MTVKLLRKLKGQERVESESVKSRKQSNLLSTHFCWPSYTATHPLIQKELSLSVEIEYTRYTRHIKINIFRITVLSSCDSSHAKIGLLFLRKTSCDRVVLPNLRCMLDFFRASVIHRTLTWTIGSLTCARVLMHAIAHGDVRSP